MIPRVELEKWFSLKAFLSKSVNTRSFLSTHCLFARPVALCKILDLNAVGAQERADLLADHEKRCCFGHQ